METEFTSQASVGFKSQGINGARHNKQQLNSDVNFMMGAGPRDSERRNSQPRSPAAMSSGPQPSYKIPEGIKNKKNFIHGTILGGVSNMTYGRSDSDKNEEINGGTDFVGGHLGKDALLSQFGNELEHPMVKHFGYEEQYADHYAKRRENERKQ